MTTNGNMDEDIEWRVEEGLVPYPDALSEMEARAAVFPPRLPAVLQKILREPFVHDAYQMYNDAITNISRHCQNVDFIDRKDFMYLHGRIARFIFSLGYSIPSPPTRNG